MFPPLVFPSACLSCLPFFCLRSTPFLVRLWSSPSSHLSILAPRQPLPPVYLSAQSAANLPSYPLSAPPTVCFSSCLPTSCLALLLTCPSLVCPTSAVYPSFVCPTPAVSSSYVCPTSVVYSSFCLPHSCCLPLNMSALHPLSTSFAVYPARCLFLLVSTPQPLSTPPPVCPTCCLPLLQFALHAVYTSSS